MALAVTLEFDETGDRQPFNLSEDVGDLDGIVRRRREKSTVHPPVGVNCVVFDPGESQQGRRSRILDPQGVARPLNDMKIQGAAADDGGRPRSVNEQCGRRGRTAIDGQLTRNARDEA